MVSEFWSRHPIHDSCYCSIHQASDRYDPAGFEGKWGNQSRTLNILARSIIQFVTQHQQFFFNVASPQEAGEKSEVVAVDNAVTIDVGILVQS